jgi:hypothetical protein
LKLLRLLRRGDYVADWHGGDVDRPGHEEGPERVVTWNLDRAIVSFKLVEQEIRHFVLNFSFDARAFGDAEGVHYYRFGLSSGRGHQLNATTHWLVYSLESGRLMKFPVEDMYRLFRRAF